VAGGGRGETKNDALEGERMYNTSLGRRKGGKIHL
jgi:hypothetical protein